MPHTNLIFIMTDNQAPWSLGCYGNPDIRTPHLDRLAAEGMQFNNAYCVNSVCSPNRATYLTGLLPSQHGVHSFLGGEKPSSQMGPDAYCTIQEFRSLSEILAERGYACGLSGKWHLGDSLHPQKGFEYWFTRPAGHTTKWVNDDLVWQGQTYVESRYTTDVIAEHAVDFLEQHHRQPFFLLLPFNGPYGLGRSMLEEHPNRHAAYYADKSLHCFPRLPMHPWLFNNRDFLNNPVSMRAYASAVSGVDDGVGAVMAALERLGCADNTLVIYTADQGLAGGHHGIWGMGDHTRPICTFEETVRVPMLWWQPGVIPAGGQSDLRVATYDFLPTVLEHLGMEDAVPDSPRLPGRSYAGAVVGREPDWDGTVFFEFENTRMIRTDQWKLTVRSPDGPHELYDMENDPGEWVNLYHDPAACPARDELRGRLDNFFSEYADLEFDLWRGGRSKAGRLLADWSHNR